MPYSGTRAAGYPAQHPALEANIANDHQLQVGYASTLVFTYVHLCSLMFT